MLYFDRINVSEGIYVNITSDVICDISDVNVIFVTIAVFYMKALNFNQMSATDDMIY